MIVTHCESKYELCIIWRRKRERERERGREREWRCVSIGNIEPNYLSSNSINNVIMRGAMYH